MKKEVKRRILIQIISIILGIMIIIPILYIFNISLMPVDEVLSIPPKFFPKKITFENYIYVFKNTKMLRYMLNSFLVASITSVMRLFLASLTAYGFSFYEFKGKNILFVLILLTILMPIKVLVVSNYQTVSDFGLIDTYLGMMIVFFINALNIFMLRQNFMTFPKELKEAAELDGLSNWKFYWKILLPLSIPVLTTIFISSFIQMWNEYVWPLLVTNKDALRTVQLGVTMFSSSDTGTSYGPLSAAAILSLLPVAVVFIIFRKRIISGTMSGSVKG